MRKCLPIVMAVIVGLTLMCAGRNAVARMRGCAVDPRTCCARSAAADSAGPTECVTGRDQSLRTEKASNAISALRLKKLAQELELSDRQRKSISDAYAKELGAKRALLRKRVDILAKMRQQALAARQGRSSKLDPQMKDIVLEYRRVERQIVEAEWTTQDEILAQLTPSQRVRCILFNEKFDRNLRACIGTCCRER